MSQEKVVITMAKDSAEVLLRAAIFYTQVQTGHYDIIAKEITVNKERMRNEEDNPRRLHTTPEEDQKIEKKAIEELNAARAVAYPELKDDKYLDISTFWETVTSDQITKDVTELLEKMDGVHIAYTVDRNKASIIMRS